MTKKKFEYLDEAIFFLENSYDSVSVHDIKSGRMALTERGVREASALGAYAKARRIIELNALADDSKLFNLVNEQENAWAKFEAGEMVEIKDPGFKPELGFKSKKATEFVNQLIADGFKPASYPVSLGDIADSIMNDESQITAKIELSGSARNRSSFPFHDFEAFSSGGPLAQIDALISVRDLRESLETCSLIVAERFDTKLTVDIEQESNFHLELSPTGNHTAFSPDAHLLNDWLEITVRELAEGRGNLAVLTQKFAHTTEIKVNPDGSHSSADPVTKNPWTLWLADRGHLFKFEFQTGAVK